MEKSGRYCAGDWQIDVALQGNRTVLLCGKRNGEKSALVLENLGFPFAFRSRQSGDQVRTSDGSFRTVAKILEDWKCGELRDEIPLVQELKSSGQSIVCIWGSVLGFKDWIVKG